MKKVINENIIRQIVRESLKKYLKESMDDYDGRVEGWTPEDVESDMEDLYDYYGNNNIHDTDNPGYASMLSQGDDRSYSTKVGRSLRSSVSDTDDAFYDEIEDGFSLSNTPEDNEFFYKHYGDGGLDEAINKAVSGAIKKLMESAKVGDAMNAVSQEMAKKYGFKPEYSGVDGGFELWKGPLPKDPLERKALLNKLGIAKFTSEDYTHNTCRITVDPSGKIASFIQKPKTPQNKLALLLRQGKVDPQKAIKYLIGKGYDPQKAEKFVQINTRQ